MLSYPFPAFVAKLSMAMDASFHITIPSALFYGYFFILLSINSNSMLCNGSSSNVSCIQSERQALLSFKQHLHDPSHRLASWVGDECCKWSGIVCHKFTGHVHKLLLGDPDDQFYDKPLSGEINPSLVDLKHLQHLDLSNSLFGAAGDEIPQVPRWLGKLTYLNIPEFLGSLGSLRYLNLSNAGFRGMIPHQLGNLTNLRTLDLQGSLYAKNLQWLSQLSSLRYLDMTHVDLEEASDWLEVTNSLPSLVVLRLGNCNLNFNFRPIYHVNFSSLSLLDLSTNNLGNNIPLWVSKLRRLTSLYLNSITYGNAIPEGIQNLTSLLHLHLSYNSFNTTIPSWLYSLSHLEVLSFCSNGLRGTISSEIKNLTSIITLDLSDNELQGKLPTSSMAQLCKLKEIHLSGNKLGNQSISQILDSWSGCVSNSLQVLDIHDGQVSGYLTNKLGQFKSLTHLDLSSNSISGPIPSSLGNLSFLRYLYLSDNHINETLPESLGQLVNLEELYIAYNQMEGIVSEAHFANTTRLRSFLAYDNQLTLKVDQDWVPPFQLKSLDMGSWHLGTGFPLWLRSQRKLSYVELSNTSLAGVLPPWVFNFSYELQLLDLSQNQMHGRIPNMANMGTQELEIDLSQNHFEGPLPSISSNVAKLDLSNNLLSGSISQFWCSRPEEPMHMIFLNLAKNQLSGEIPNCWRKWKNIRILFLNYNNFGGGIPSSFGSLDFLQSLHLESNNLSGTFSLSSLHSCTNLFSLDLSQNKLGGNIPVWLGTSLVQLRVFSAGFNEFHGHLPHELCGLNSLQILDLSNNNLSGSIPKCFNNFSTMATKMTDDIGDDIGGFWYSIGITDYYYTEIALLTMKGKPVEYSKTLGLVNTIDLSNNSLSGHIPVEITSLSNLLSLNLSNNLLEGEIPTKIGNMDALESIDFSKNRLSGEIPGSMSSLSFLSYLNLSYNNLSGKIPTGTQLQSLNSSGFIGNNLCGPPLTPNCSKNGEITIVEKNKKEDYHEMSGFYIGMAVGFIVGFWGLCGSLFFNRTWRHTYFGFLDHIKDYIYVAAVLKLRWLCEMITKCRHTQ